MKHILAKTKGSILAYSLILLTIVLVASVGMMSSSLVNFRSVSVSERSGNAFQVADSGAQAMVAKIKAAGDPSERIRTLFSPPGLCDSPSKPINLPLGSYQISFFGGDGNISLDCNDAIAEITSVKSIGTYRDTTRAVQVAVAPAPTLVGWWKFNGDTYDETLNHNDGTRSGFPNPDLVNAPNGANQALDIDGGSGVVTIDNESNFDMRRTISISLWFRVDNFPTVWAPFVSKMDNAGSITSRVFSVWVNGSGRYIHLASSDGVVQDLVETPNNSINSGTWYHYVGVIDRDTRTLKSYIDGVLLASGVIPNTSLQDAVANDHPVKIGGDFLQQPPPDTYEAFDGLIDDVRIYDGVLSASDVSRLYNIGNGRE